MITNFLLDHSALVPVLLLLLAVLCSGVGYLVAHRPRVLWTLFALSLLPVFVLTLTQAGVRMDEVRCTLQFAMPTLGSVELLANVALFLPPALLATVGTRRPLVVLVAAAALSAAIEAVQAIVPGIGRACDTNDWLMNSAGAAIGVLLGVAVRRAGRRGDVASR